jgi:hypothetical protein
MDTTEARKQIDFNLAHNAVTNDHNLSLPEGQPGFIPADETLVEESFENTTIAIDVSQWSGRPLYSCDISGPGGMGCVESADLDELADFLSMKLTKAGL